MVQFGEKAEVRELKIKGPQRTCDVQTLFRATKAKVCANIVPGRSRLASIKGMRTALRRSCGKKASDSKWNTVDDVGEEEER